MKLLLDTCVWGGTVEPLRQAGHDVIWIGTESPDPGDREILARALREKRILMTLDKDFGELAIVRGFPHCGIIRVVDVSANLVASTCLQVLGKHGQELEAGAIVTVSTGRVRIRPPDDWKPADP